MSGLLSLIWVPITVFLLFVAPFWIFAHYATRWRTARTLSSKDETLLNELRESAERMEQRLGNLERILDAESSDWRKQP